MRSSLLKMSFMAFIGTGVLGVAACRDTATVTHDLEMISTTVDLSGQGPVDMAGGGPTDDAGGNGKGCNGKVYVTSTIAAMRMGSVGCHEFDNVVSISGVNGNGKSATLKIYVQDAAGGDFSAIQVKCVTSMSAANGGHACPNTGPVYMALATMVPGHSLTIKGDYIKTKSTGFEEFYIDSITDNGAAAAPAPTVVMPADISRNAQLSKYFFQQVTTTITDPLVMYDWSPSELAYSGMATKCPYQFGWGMAPKSVAAVAGMACPAGNKSQPAGQKTPPASEVLIGTDFFVGFTYSSDCQCYTMFRDQAPTAMSTVTGKLSGILVYEVPFGGMVGYQYIAPQANADFPITNTVSM